MKVDWQPIETCPRETRYAWLFCRLDGVYVGMKGIGGEWWTSQGVRAWAPSHWAPYIVPDPPEGS